MSAYTHLTTDQKFDLLVEGQTRLERDIKSVKRTLKKIHADQNMIINHFDRADIKCTHRLDRIEDILNLPSIC